MNPDTNRFENLEAIRAIKDAMGHPTTLVRPDGSPVPQHWTTFVVDEHVAIKGYTFKVAYVGETSILFEPVGPVVVSGDGESP